MTSEEATSVLAMFADLWPDYATKLTAAQSDANRLLLQSIRLDEDCARACVRGYYGDCQTSKPIFGKLIARMREEVSRRAKGTMGDGQRADSKSAPCTDARFMLVGPTPGIYYHAVIPGRNPPDDETQRQAAYRQYESRLGGNGDAKWILVGPGTPAELKVAAQNYWYGEDLAEAMRIAERERAGLIVPKREAPPAEVATGAEDF